MNDELQDPVIEVDDPHLNGGLADGDVVQWGERRPWRVGPGGFSAAALGGFALGAAATLSVLALCGWVGPKREFPNLSRFR